MVRVEEGMTGHRRVRRYRGPHACHDRDHDVSGTPLHRVARAATAPVRGYLNEHFEMVKDEVRRTASIPPPAVTVAAPVVDDSAAWVRVAELENTLAELSLYQTRVMTRMTDEVSDLAGRIDELERIVRQLASVVAASHDQTSHDQTP